MTHDATASAEHVDHAEHPHVNYQFIFIMLCICTLVSMVLDFVPMSRSVVAVLAMAIAVAKAQFVMRFFMHLKFEGRWKYVLLLPTAILACGLPLALAPDIALHYYRTERPEAVVLNHGDHGSEHATGHGVSHDRHDEHVPAHELKAEDGVGH